MDNDTNTNTNMTFKHKRKHTLEHARPLDDNHHHHQLQPMPSTPHSPLYARYVHHPDPLYDDDGDAVQTPMVVCSSPVASVSSSTYHIALPEEMPAVARAQPGAVTVRLSSDIVVDESFDEVSH